MYTTAPASVARRALHEKPLSDSSGGTAVEILSLGFTRYQSTYRDVNGTDTVYHYIAFR
jgi:hypothetical protein